MNDWFVNPLGILEFLWDPLGSQFREPNITDLIMRRINHTEGLGLYQEDLLPLDNYDKFRVCILLGIVHAMSLTHAWNFFQQFIDGFQM